MLRPVLENYQGEYDVHFLNVNDHMEAARKHNVRAVPTVFIFKNGLLAGGFKGFTGKAQIDKILTTVKEEEESL
jgi:thioredoxin-like negative regulator of GroEL